jgi:hypothetical protein
MASGVSRLPGAVEDAVPCTPAGPDGTTGPPGGVFVVVSEDQGRHSIKPRAKRPAAIPTATRADLKIV